MTRTEQILDILKNKANGDNILPISTIELGQILFPGRDKYKAAIDVAGYLRAMEKEGILQVFKVKGKLTSVKIVESNFKPMKPFKQKMVETQHGNLLVNCSTFRKFFVEEKQNNPNSSFKEIFTAARNRFYEKVESGAWRYIKGMRAKEWGDQQLMMWLRGYITNSDKMAGKRQFEQLIPERVYSKSNQTKISQPAPIVDAVLIGQMIKEAVSELERRIGKLDILQLEAIRRLDSIQKKMEQ